MTEEAEGSKDIFAFEKGRDAYSVSYDFSFKCDHVTKNRDGSFTTSDGRRLETLGDVIADAARDVLGEMERAMNRPLPPETP